MCFARVENPYKTLGKQYLLGFWGTGRVCGPRKPL